MFTGWGRGAGLASVGILSSVKTTAPHPVPPSGSGLNLNVSNLYLGGFFTLFHVSFTRSLIIVDNPIKMFSLNNNVIMHNK